MHGGKTNIRAGYEYFNGERTAGIRVHVAVGVSRDLNDRSHGGWAW